MVELAAEGAFVALHGLRRGLIEVILQPATEGIEGLAQDLVGLADKNLGGPGNRPTLVGDKFLYQAALAQPSLTDHRQNASIAPFARRGKKWLDKGIQFG